MPTTVALSREQQQIVKTARKMLARECPMHRVRTLMASRDGFEPADHELVSEAGWLGIASGDEHGGAGYGVVERCLLFEEMGASLLPAPVLSSGVLAVDALSIVAVDGPLRQELLADAIAGRRRATLVAGGDLLAGDDPAGSVWVQVDDDRHALSGDGGLTIDGGSADVLLVAARLPYGELGLFVVDPLGPGVQRTPVSLIDETRKVARIELNAAPGERIDDGHTTAIALRTVLDRALVALAAEMVGGAQRCLDMTVEYAKVRKQFGVPIGSFQAIKHRCADMSIAIDAARQVVLMAADTIDSDAGDDTASAAAAAKLAATEAFLQVSAEAIQLHGGIGFTADHDAQLFYKRAWVSASLLGDQAAMRRRLVTELDL